MQDIPSPENKRHYPGLDGLRAVAVLLVMVQHYLYLDPWIRWGWVGVRIFFVLSGFLITGILYDTRDAERRWSVFYIRRALRIFPLYYGLLLLAVLLIPVFHWIVRPSWILWPLYLQNYARFIWPADVPSGIADHLRSAKYTNPQLMLFYGHFWSLAIEEQFYLIWPLVVFWVKRRETLMKICAWVIVLSPVARFLSCFVLSQTALDNGFQERFTFFQCDALLLGALFALWMRGPHPDMTLLGRRILWAFVGIVMVAEVACKMIFHEYLAPNIASPIFASIGYSVINAGSAGLILLAIDGKTLWSRFLNNRALRYIGTISYGFYVFHDIPHFFYNLLANQIAPEYSRHLAPFCIGLVSTLVIASASYYGFERPFLRLKDRFVVTAPKRTQMAG